MGYILGDMQGYQLSAVSCQLSVLTLRILQ
jgi:hypothetical protein